MKLSHALRAGAAAPQAPVPLRPFRFRDGPTSKRSLARIALTGNRAVC